jgi:hypothetical protein
MPVCTASLRNLVRKAGLLDPISFGIDLRAGWMPACIQLRPFWRGPGPGPHRLPLCLPV